MTPLPPAHDPCGPPTDMHAHHASLLDAINEHALVSATDCRGLITYINPRFQAVSQYAPEELMGKTHSHIASGLHPREFYERIWHTLTRGEIWRGEICNRKKDGSLFWVDAAIVPTRTPQGDITGYTSVSLDITDFRETEAELRHHQQHLRELVAERTADLLAAKEEAELANRAKSEFLANISHELRTPLHAILSFTRLAQTRLQRGNPDDIGDFLGDIYSAGQRQLSLVNDLLDLAKIESGQYNLAPSRQDIRPILEASVRSLAGLLDAQGLQVHWQSSTHDTHAWADSARMQQVFINLLSNAIKFSPQHGRLILRLSDDVLPQGRRDTDAGNSPALRIELQDAGVGIPEDELESIFDKFVQSRHTRHGAGGTGLGLSICREIVQAHFGRIEARNNPEIGATFSVRLPRTDPARA